MCIAFILLIKNLKKKEDTILTELNFKSNQTEIVRNVHEQ